VRGEAIDHRADGGDEPETVHRPRTIDRDAGRAGSAGDRWNEREAAAVRRWLPATAPSPALTLLSAAAEGGALWVAVGAALRVCQLTRGG
jgi:hypothetical protein